MRVLLCCPCWPQLLGSSDPPKSLLSCGNFRHEPPHPAENLFSKLSVMLMQPVLREALRNQRLTAINDSLLPPPNLIHPPSPLLLYKALKPHLCFKNKNKQTNKTFRQLLEKGERLFCYMPIGEGTLYIQLDFKTCQYNTVFIFPLLQKRKLRLKEGC